jgi:polyhydroxyalkanoate synthesis regulator phasin
MTLNEIIHKAVMAGLGIPEKFKEIIDELVKKGELSESQGAKLIKEYTEKICKTGDALNREISEIIKKTLEKMNIPTRDEVEKLNRKISSLSARIKKLEESSGIDKQ